MDTSRIFMKIPFKEAKQVQIVLVETIFTIYIKFGILAKNGFEKKKRHLRL